MFVVRNGEVKLSSTQSLVTHIRTYSSYREITVLQSFLAQFPSSIITGDLSNMCMVYQHSREEEKDKRKEKNWAGFCIYKWGDMKNATYARHSDHPSLNFHETLQGRY